MATKNKQWLQTMAEKDYQVYKYDFTWHTTPDKWEELKDKIIKHLTIHCSRWCFQLESGELNGSYHLQGRCSLKEKRTLKTTIKFFSEVGGGKPHLSKTSKNCDNNFKYVCKEETRVAGPWSHDDIMPYMPIQFRHVVEYKKWQRSVVDMPADLRRIHCLIDGLGNIGKSTFVGHMCCLKKAQCIPFCNDFRDIMRLVMDKPKSSLYFIDLPRAIKKDRLFQLFAGIEKVKDGNVFDDRYGFREEWIDSPEIWVFTNTEPDLTYLSLDRWNLWRVNENEELVKYNSSVPSMAENLKILASKNNHNGNNK